MDRIRSIYRNKGRAVPYLFFFWATLLVIVLGAFVAEDISYFSSTAYGTFMNEAEFYTVFAAAIVSIIGLLLYARRHFVIPVKWGFAILFGVLFIGNLIGTFAFPSHMEGMGIGGGWEYNTPYSIDFTIAERIHYVLAFGLACFYFYAFVAIFPYLFHSSRQTDMFARFALFVAAFTILYSFVAEYRYYLAFFNFIPTEGVPSAPLSFTNNPNTFALFLLVGQFCAFFLYCRRSHFLTLVLGIFMMYFQLIVHSGTGITVAALMALAFGIYRFVLGVIRNSMRTVFYTIFWTVFITTTAVLGLSGVLGPSSPLTKSFAFLRNDYINMSRTSISGRLSIWTAVLAVLRESPVRLFFGIGDMQALFYLGQLIGPNDYEVVYYTHNGVLAMLLYGGLLRVLVYYFLLGRFLYMAFQLHFKGSRVAFMCIIGVACFAIQGFTETTTTFLLTDTKGMIFYLLLSLPVEVEWMKQKHTEVFDYEEMVSTYKKDKVRYEMSPLHLSSMAFLLLTPVCVTLLAVGPSLAHAGYFHNYLGPSFYIALLEAWLLIPLGMFALGFIRSRSARLGLCAFFFIVGVLLLLSGLFFIKFLPDLAHVSLIVLPVLCLLPFFILLPRIMRQKFPLFTKVYLPYLCIGFGIFMINIPVLFIPQELMTFQIPLAAAIFDIILFFAIMLLPKMDAFAYPLNIMYLRFDASMTAIGVRWGRRREIKQCSRLHAPSPMVKERVVHRFRF